MKPPATLLCATLLAVAAAGPARCGQASAPHSDGSVEIVGKYEELVGHDLRLGGDPRTYRLVKDEHLRVLLALTSHRDNLRIVGRTVTGPDASFVEVDSLEVAPGDTEVFRRRLDAIAPSAPDRADRMSELALEMARNYAEYRDPEVLELSRDVALRAIRTRSEAADADVASCVRWIREVHEQTGEPSVTFAILVEIDRVFPRDPEVGRFLRELNCRRHGGAWVTYEEFKRLEGFVLYQGKWVKPRDRDFSETLRGFDRLVQTNLILRRRTEREYRVLAEKGEVDEGMRPEEVAAALGPPERVERRLYSQKEFDQWIYGERYYYFYGGFLVKKP